MVSAFQILVQVAHFLPHNWCFGVGLCRACCLEWVIIRSSLFILSGFLIVTILFLKLHWLHLTVTSLVTLIGSIFIELPVM